MLTEGRPPATKPEFKQNDPPELGLVATERHRKPLEPALEALAIQIAAFDELYGLVAAEQLVSQRTQRVQEDAAESIFGPPRPQLRWPELLESSAHEAARFARPADY